MLPYEGQAIFSLNCHYVFVVQKAVSLVSARELKALAKDLGGDEGMFIPDRRVKLFMGFARLGAPEDYAKTKLF